MGLARETVETRLKERLQKPFENKNLQKNNQEILEQKKEIQSKDEVFSKSSYKQQDTVIINKTNNTALKEEINSKNCFDNDLSFLKTNNKYELYRKSYINYADIDDYFDIFLSSKLKSTKCDYRL